MNTTYKKMARTLFLSLLFTGIFFCTHSVLADVTLETQENGITINQVEKGHEFLVRIFVADVTDLYGSAFDLAYDPQYLKVVDTTPLLEKTTPKVTEGEVVNQANAAETLLLAALENGKNGRLVIGLSRKGTVSGVTVGTTGSLLASAHFQAIQPSTGPISISFSTPGLQDSNGVDIQVNSWQIASLTVLDLVIQKLDINDDESIDLQDLILAVQVQTQQATSQKIYTEADISGDNKVGMPEALAIIQVLAGSRTAPSAP